MNRPRFNIFKAQGVRNQAYNCDGVGLPVHSASTEASLILTLTPADMGTIWVRDGVIKHWNGATVEIIGGSSAVVNNYSADEQPFYNPDGTQQTHIGDAPVYWQTFVGVSVNAPPASIFGVIPDLDKIISFETTNEATGEPGLVQIKKSGGNLSVCALVFNGEVVGDSVSYPSNYTITVWFTKTA